MAASFRPSLTYSGSFEFDEGVDKAALILHLAECLRKLNAHDIRPSQVSVSFRGGVFRGVSNWNILIPFERGELMVDETAHEVRYRLSFHHLVFFAAIFFGFGCLIAWPDSKFDPAIPLVLGLGCLFLVGGNLMLGIPRFHRFLRDAIDSLPVRR
jgi:hypothetical protein